ncbi:hypothetical protein [Gloeobacter kilaueensis]|uniref:Uncharacterized protein n=1 Tax=Gloeobacter kilaueensis (strain ATCC BAA-2537 / CCAP 1431/1 / ULC 316 / JS1) TaxID=1183438 RepID=U5QK00_GLOK1|nr:hypothetical protein [Gloeobacter kilaueensis]AGY57990.1 hypothetical protein GKIL_1744 [Gloeobacter kilaueensis JS1]
MESQNPQSQMLIQSAVVLYDGQQIPIGLDIAQDDELLVKALVPYFPEVTNASITRAVKGAVLEIALSKRAGHKGNTVTNFFSALSELSESINPIVLLYREWQEREATGNFSLDQKIEMIPRLEATLTEGTALKDEVDAIFAAVALCKPIPALQAPMGF